MGQREGGAVEQQLFGWLDERVVEIKVAEVEGVDDGLGETETETRSQESVE